MDPRAEVNVYHHPSYGVVLSCFGSDVADQFEDFLAEVHDLSFSLKFEGDKTSFYFGKKTSTTYISGLFERFLDQATKT